MTEPVKIKFLATGGTIDKIYFDARSDFQVGDPQVIGIMETVNPGFSYEVRSLFRKDSLDLTDADRAVIREAVIGDEGERFVITHGTDTMAQTAEFLSGIANKTIVLTGAMGPAKFRDSDAAFNVGCAVAAVQCLPPGVYLACNGEIFEAGKVRKNREAMRFEPID